MSRRLGLLRWRRVSARASTRTLGSGETDGGAGATSGLGWPFPAHYLDQAVRRGYAHLGPLRRELPVVGGGPCAGRVLTVVEDRYGSDVLGPNARHPDRRAPKRGRSTTVEAAVGLVVEDATTDWCGEIVRVERDLGTVVLEDRHGTRRSFPLGPGFLLEGAPVVLTAPARKAPPAAASRTASGSVAVPGAAARVARASRIFVEGRHDAELVERVWGDDLRLEGVVVEYLAGVDRLEEELAGFGPGRVAASACWSTTWWPAPRRARLPTPFRRGPFGSDVLVVGHPYIDVWQAVKPSSVGIPAWPTVPRGEEWKYGVASRLGWPHADQERHRAGLAAHPRLGAVVRRPRARPPRPRRAAHRLRHHLTSRPPPDHPPLLSRPSAPSCPDHPPLPVPTIRRLPVPTIRRLCPDHPPASVPTIRRFRSNHPPLPV